MSKLLKQENNSPPFWTIGLQYCLWMGKPDIIYCNHLSILQFTINASMKVKKESVQSGDDVGFVVLLRTIHSSMTCEGKRRKIV